MHQYATALVNEAGLDELNSDRILFSLADESKISLDVQLLSVTALFKKLGKDMWKDAAFWTFDPQRAINYFHDLIREKTNTLSENKPETFPEAVWTHIRINNVRDEYIKPKTTIQAEDVKPLSDLVKIGDLSWAPDPSPDIKHSTNGNDLNLEVIDYMMVSKELMSLFIISLAL